MRVRVFNGAPHWYDRTMQTTPIIYDGEVIILFDQSKSNTAMLIGDLFGNVIDITEMSGNDKEYYPNKPGDTTDFCVDMEHYILSKSRALDVLAVYCEETITKRQIKPGTKEYYAFHKVSKILNEVRSAIMNIGLKITGFAVEEINNSAWKGVMLQGGFNKQGEKGSYTLWSQKNPERWLHYSDDVTDVYSMYLYVLATKYHGKPKKAKKVSKSRYDYTLVSTIMEYIPPNLQEVKYNIQLSFEENVNYAVSTFETSYISMGNIELPLDILYKTAAAPMTPDSRIALVIKRR